ncbi:MAG TPA: hypothetical protein PKH39_10165 [Woeseiaceae bacterium]|nr:hypothetical protein [Woeseiaceae bacterium]
MYEQHFGLKKPPFRAKATGTDVFVGPQIATAMAGLKKALIASDAVATVSGPVGSGKTTLVMKALESMVGRPKVVRVGRMRLDTTDVLGLLLDELGIENQPRGTIQKFNAFRRRLKEMEDSETRLVIAIEDSQRLGLDTLAEIEAVTAADAGLSEGAGIVLMGDEDLEQSLRDPQLGRLCQRIRQRLHTTPLPPAELRGYLRHCFRLAGGDFEQVFDTDAALLLHHLTGGVPRLANTVIESAMATAVDQGLDKVSSELLARTGESEFGLSAAGFEFTPPPAPEASAKTASEKDIVTSSHGEPAPEPAPEADPVTPAPVSSEPVKVFADVPESADLPELIQDTLPDLQVLAPEFAVADEPPIAKPETEPGKSEPELLTLAPDVPEQDMPEAVLDVSLSEPEMPKPVADRPDIDAEMPVLALEEQSQDSKIDSDEIPDWDRDPTMAELRPDLDALEQALAFTQENEPEPKTSADNEHGERNDKQVDNIPEITLDHAISQRIESQLIDEPGQISPAPQSESEPDETKPEIPALKITASKTNKSDTEIQKIAAELSRAKSLEDVDDRMAETLFGDELSLVASQFMKKAVPAESANDDIEDVAAVEVVAETQATEQQATAAGNATAVSNAPAGSVSANSVDVEVTLDSDSQPVRGGMDLSASQRLKTVRALNADLHPSLREPESKAANDAVQPVTSNKPESIEDQINISMTQTLKALNVRAPVSHDEDEDDNKGKSGFFSRFKRS